jgi:hypothetical protein
LIIVLYNHTCSKNKFNFLYQNKLFYFSFISIKKILVLTKCDKIKKIEIILFIYVFSIKSCHNLQSIVKMNSNSIATLTFCDRAENHAGMETLGNMVSKGEGFNIEDLINIKQKLQEKGIEAEIIPLEMFQDINEIDFDMPVPEEAYLLRIPNGVDKLLQVEVEDDVNQLQLFNEHCALDLDKKAWMKGKVVNKHARWNLCFDDFNRGPDYENKMGRIVAFDDVPITKMLLNKIGHYFGEKAQNLKCEGNYYYDSSKCGIGFHGDSERRKVIGVRLGTGMSSPMHFQWFHDSKPVGERIIIPLNAGDIYIMSEKAVGQDWKRRSIYTLRHATGSNKFVTI